MDHLSAQRVLEGKEGTHSTEPLTNPSFLRVWRQSASNLTVMKPGSDYCDTCTHLHNSIDICLDEGVKETLSSKLPSHRDDAAAVFENNRSFYERAAANLDSDRMHFVFHFVEKFLLLHLLTKPCQLHLVTGLKFKFFGACLSNIGVTEIHCLPEGHWPSGKTAAEVASMLHYSI